MKNELKEWLIGEIESALKDYEGARVYGCDLAYTIFEGANADGSYTCSTYQAKEWIKKYWDEIGEVVEEIKFQFGSEFIPNVFDEAEKFQVVIILEGANYILSHSKTVEHYWDDEFELTKSRINKIVKEIKESNNSYDFYN